MYEPRFENGIGYCDPKCSEHDGSRCRLIGSHAPTDHVCEPWARELMVRQKFAGGISLSSSEGREPDIDAVSELLEQCAEQKKLVVAIKGNAMTQPKVLGEQREVLSRMLVMLTEARMNCAKEAVDRRIIADFSETRGES